MPTKFGGGAAPASGWLAFWQELVDKQGVRVEEEGLEPINPVRMFRVACVSFVASALGAHVAHWPHFLTLKARQCGLINGGSGNHHFPR